MLLILLITLAIITFFMTRTPTRKRLKSKAEPQLPQQRSQMTPEQQRQLHKVYYASDADRIRELNLLSPNAGKFMRLLRQTFAAHEVVVKAQRFFVVNAAGYPFAIFEYRDASQPSKMNIDEDGLPLFLYHSILSSQSLQEDAAQLLSVQNPHAAQEF